MVTHACPSGVDCHRASTGNSLKDLNSPPEAAQVFQLCPPRRSLPCQRLLPYHEGLQTIISQSANHSPSLASYTG